MAQFDSDIQQRYFTALHKALQFIAQKPTLQAATDTLLPDMMLLADGDCAFYSVITEPHSSHTYNIIPDAVPENDWLVDVASNLPDTIQASTTLTNLLQAKYSHALWLPVKHQENLVAVCGILAPREMRLTNEQKMLLESLLNCLKVVTIAAKVDAQHLKFTRNQNEFVRIVSHDLRSPLTSIKGFASMLESAEEDPQKAHFVEKILNGVDQMTSLVDNIQDAGRYDRDTGFYEMERAPTDLIDIVQGIIRNHLVPAEKQEITLAMDITDDIPIVNVDANMIERSIINLVDNAIKYTPNGGTIEVGLRTENHHLIISIKDTGYGISEENIQNLFQRHFRIRRREHARVKGSGLGLFIVRNVALHHGGDAFVKSTLGEGSTFGIRIPLQGENLLGGASV